MKKIPFLKSALIIIIISILSSCNPDNGDDQPIDQYLVSYEKYKTYLPAFIKSVLSVLEDDYPQLKDISDQMVHGVDVYKITYMTKFDGKDIMASGIVSIPVSEGAFPIISFQNGTNTLHNNAPSVNPGNELYTLLQFMASAGFVVSVPDYLGFGASKAMFHPYLDKESTVQTVTDMLRAVNELMTIHLDKEVSKDLFIAGYSQGGWATMQLQKTLEQGATGEFNLKASACGAGPYDLKLVNNYILSEDEYPMPYFIGYIFNSYINLEDITNSSSDVFKSPYSDRILQLYDGTKSGEEINAQLTTTTNLLFTEEYKTTASTNAKFSTVISTLEKNSVVAWKTNVPTMLLHGSADNYVPPTTSTNLYNGFVAQGVDKSKVTLVPIPGAGHTTGIVPSCVAAFNWFIELNLAN
jgi:pimeloyl-ACP methyl ester carboxylesterase